MARFRARRPGSAADDGIIAPKRSRTGKAPQRSAAASLGAAQTRRRYSAYPSRRSGDCGREEVHHPAHTSVSKADEIVFVERIDINQMPLEDFALLERSEALALEIGEDLAWGAVPLPVIRVQGEHGLVDDRVNLHFGWWLVQDPAPVRRKDVVNVRTLPKMQAHLDRFASPKIADIALVELHLHCATFSSTGLITPA